MKRRFKFFSVLTLIAVIMAFSMSVFAAEPESVDVGVQEEASAAYDELMNSFPQSKSTGDRVYPDYYGGAYINDEGRLVVYVTDLNKAPSLMSVDDNNAIIYQECEYSYNELNDTMDTLNEYKFSNLDSDIANNFNSYALLDKENRVEVRLDEFSEEKIQEFKDAVFDSDTIIFVEATQPIEEYTKNYDGADTP